MARAISFLVMASVLLVPGLTADGAVVSAPSAQGPGQIAYLGPGGSVWLTDAAGRERKELSGGEAFAWIEWAPDGQKLALLKGGLAWREGNEIYVVQANGSGPVKVADGYAPVWSSDSQQLLYVTDFFPSEEGGDQALKVVNVADGRDRTLVTRRWISGLWPIERVSYSPGDEMIAVYVAGLEMEGHAVILDSEGALLWEVPDYIYSADSFAWSPCGRYFAYRDSGEPFLGGREPALKIAQVETRETIASLREAGFWPRWSPDGERIAAFLWQEGGDFRVVIVDTESWQLIEQSDTVFGNIWSSRPQWSPDSSSLLFASWEEVETHVHVMDQAGAARSIAQGQDPEVDWSPDGSWVALAVGEQGGREIYVVRADGSDLHKVGDGWMPRWRPSGAPSEFADRLLVLAVPGGSVAVALLVGILIWTWWRRRSAAAK